MKKTLNLISAKEDEFLEATLIQASQRDKDGTILRRFAMVEMEY